jgi:FAD/FMN-containing dehydrogenase
MALLSFGSRGAARSIARPAAELAALGQAIDGEALLPDSPDYERARKPPIVRFQDVRPEAIVLCRNPDDVVETIAVARLTGLETAIRSGGHCFAGRSSARGIVIDVSPMRSVSVDRGIATVGAGTTLGEVYDALNEHGRTIAAGCGPSVGIAGLVLGGGLGILGRRHGLTSDRLVGAEVVLADGRVVECDAQRDEDLFWALRGAGAGSFGVVTRLELRTLPSPTATSFHVAWPAADAAAVIDAWQDWAPESPDEIAASLLVVAPGDPALPPAVTVFGAMLGTAADAAELLGALVACSGATPASSALTQMSYPETKRYLSEHGPGDDLEGALYSRSEFFRRPLPAATIAALVDQLVRDRLPGQSRELDFTPWGGAYNRVREDATAFPHRSERFLLKHAVVVEPGGPAAERAARGWLARSWELVHPYGSGGVYPNFPDPDLDDPGRAYYGANYDRLVRVKASYDPAGFFRLG